VIRDVLSGEVPLARSLLSSCRDDPADLLRQVSAVVAWREVCLVAELVRTVCAAPYLDRTSDDTRT